MAKLAILGGEPTVPAGMIKKWPPIDEIDRKFCLDSLNGPVHAYGENCKAFAEEFARWNGNRYAVPTNSGTAALHMGVAACGCGTGDEVIVTAYSWSSSVTCVLHHNALPVFVDIDYDTVNMDVERIEAAITEKTKAIIVVHLHGLAVNMEKVMAIARKHNLKVIEDCCQAHGATFKGKKVGRWGDCAAFSLNHNKCLCAGEGGVFVTDNEQIQKAASMVWSFGETRTPLENRDYHAYALGWMYRMPDLTAAFARAQLTKLDGYLETTARNAAAFLEPIRKTRGLLMPVVPEGSTHNWYNVVLRVDPEGWGYSGKASLFRNVVQKAICAEGVPVMIWQSFILPAMTVFQARNAYGKGCPWECPNAGRSIVYNPADYPMAQKYLERHFALGMALRPPNDEKTSRLCGEAVRKVLETMKESDIEPILAIKK